MLKILFNGINDLSMEVEGNYIILALSIPNVRKQTVYLSKKEIYCLIYQGRLEMGSGAQICYQGWVSLFVSFFPLRDVLASY